MQKTSSRIKTAEEAMQGGICGRPGMMYWLPSNKKTATYKQLEQIKDLSENK